MKRPEFSFFEVLYSVSGSGIRRLHLGRQELPSREGASWHYPGFQVQGSVIGSSTHLHEERVLAESPSLMSGQKQGVFGKKLCFSFHCL